MPSSNQTTLQSTSNSTNYTTDSFTPPAGELLVVFAGVADSNLSAPTLTSDVSGDTFTLVGQAQFNADSGRLYVFIADQLSTNTAQTLTFDCTGDTAGGIVLSVESVPGMTAVGSAALRQPAAVINNEDDDTTHNIIFSSNVLTTNPTLTARSRQNTTDGSVPTGWTSLGNGSFGTPNHRTKTAGRDSGFTGTTITWAAYGGTGQVGLIAIELDASGGGGAADVLPQGIQDLEAGNVGLSRAMQNLEKGFIA